jgi:hypothetical protein
MPVGSAGLSAYHAAWHATDGSGPRLAGLQLADGWAVLEEASLIVEGDHIAGPITSGRMPPTPAGPGPAPKSPNGRRTGT